MPKPKKERGRPLKRPYPPRVDATAEEMARQGRPSWYLWKD